ncbi:rhomboid family intramembrane serine protease [Hymenobacter sediminicola]|uniref:Rhomboid family intramembrane serine protease n=1 Tax=Hymenobacter sediminicola TaxID=2761579 RepID=A0A7G7WBR2_9BACT|nr:rhomboid family intramembrane serine protease [Hymenobacter sediminicola]QNH63805.1 rhomboid family intramembrane serine protease [Hymenobacter sediminicola]
MLANFGYKLRLLYFPVVALGVLLALLIGSGYWLLTVRLALFDPSSSQLFAGIFGLSALGMWPLLYKRLQLLRRGSDDRWVMLYYMAPMAVAGFTSLFLLDYLQERTSRLIRLTSIQELRQHPTATRYFTLQECHPSRQFAGAYPAISVSGKHDEHLDFDLYLACPLLPTPTDTTAVAGWLGLHFEHQVSNRLEEAQKEAEFQAFLQRSQDTFNAQDLTRFRYLTRVSGREDRREFQQAVQASLLRTATPAPAVVLQPEHTPFADRAAAARRHLACTLGIGWGVFLLMLVFPHLSSTDVEQWQQGIGRPSLWQQGQLFLRENPGVRATPVLVLLNVAVYLLMVSLLGGLSFRTPDLLAWGGSYRPLVLAGDYWRLLTPMFLHGGLLHIIYNMISLAVIGYMLEPMLGTGRLVLTYVLTGIAGVLASILWAPDTISVGASGAIFGLLGLMLGLIRRATPAARGMLLILPVVFGLPGLLLGFFSPTTDNAGHIGGLLGGILLGLWWQVHPEQTT